MTSADDLLVQAAGLPTEDLVELVGRLRSRLPAHATLIVGHDEPHTVPGDDSLLVVAPSDVDRYAPRFGPARFVQVLAAEDGMRLLTANPRPLARPTERPAAPGEGVPDGPIFVGGTGRSGTWAIGRLMGAHPRWTTVPSELRFHARKAGFAAVLQGRRSPEAFAADFEERWFRPSRATGRPKGIQVLIQPPMLRWHLDRFVERARHDIPGALAQLLMDIVQPYAHTHGAVGWAETTPANAMAAATLTVVLPQARIVHTVRDGRDVAASVATMPWGPDTMEEGLEWWAHRLRRAHAAATRGDATRVHVVRLEELLYLDRDRTFDELVDFAGFTDTAPLRTYFDGAMDGSRGNVGRWRSQVDGARRAAIDARYRELVIELAEAGVGCTPAEPDAVDELVTAGI